MAVDIKVPVLPESVADATIVTWHKKPGENVSRDENLVDIETDKVVLEVVAPSDGVLEKIIKNEGDVVGAQEVIAIFNEGAKGSAAPAQTANNSAASTEAAAPTEAPAQDSNEGADISPAVRRLLNENGLNVTQIPGTGKGGRVTKTDVENFIKNKGGSGGAPQAAKAPAAKTSTAPSVEVGFTPGERLEKRVPMTRLRARIAERLVEAQHTAAILTTFNEINMQPVMELRARYKDKFEKEHGVRLGFMSFFTQAVVEALKRFPDVNASIDGSDIVYHGYFDIGIAVSSPRGLVVPIIRNAETLSMAQIEAQIRDYGERAQKGTLGLDEITGGTFTISNGGVFGSLMATPILNPPQSGILGMHKIEQRPVVENGEIVIRPMMYIALSYDHRIIDGKESVQFLLTIKEMLEDPARLLLGV